jgi:hypothetical protein
MPSTRKDNKLTIPFIAACTIILVLIVFIIFRPAATVISSDKEKQLRDSLVLLESNINTSLARQHQLQNQYDSLSAIGPGIIYRNHETTKFIFNTASPTQLDSIIRAAWSIKGY